MARKTATTKSVETLRHTEDKRKNIPTAEHQSVLEKEQEVPRTVKYPRNTDLDPQLVWRGKDEQDWSDLVVLSYIANHDFSIFRSSLIIGCSLVWWPSFIPGFEKPSCLDAISQDLIQCTRILDRC